MSDCDDRLKSKASDDKEKVNDDDATKDQILNEREKNNKKWRRKMNANRLKQTMQLEAFAEISFPFRLCRKCDQTPSRL